MDHLQIIGDPTRLTQILFNLLGNATKFTEKGHISLTAKAYDGGEDTVSLWFEIADTGIGIPEDRQQIIFEPFTQASSRTNRQYHGTGLGLSITNRLIELHGSSLNFWSIEGRGSKFVFELKYPKSNTNSYATGEALPAFNSLAQLNVLVAEDNAINVLVLKKTLNKWEIKPDIVVNGQEAVDAVINKDYDVILMDINMPVMDGFEAAQKIRELKATKKSEVHIIALTASIGAAVQDSAGYGYLDDFMLKPFIPDELKNKLYKLNKDKQQKSL